MSDSSVDTVKVSNENPESVDQLPRRSDRVSIPTEKMSQYKAEETESREKKLFKAFDKWRVVIREVRNTLKNACDEPTLSTLIDRVKTHEETVINHFKDLRAIGTISQETVRKVDACSAVSIDMTKIINERLCEIDTFDQERETQRLRAIKHAEYAKSIFSKSDNGSVRSMHSTQSKISERMAEATADLAAKQAELRMLKEEQEHKDKLIQLEYEQKRALEAHQNELKRLQTRRDLEIAHARLNAYSQMNEIVRTYNDTPTTNIDQTLENLKQEQAMQQESTLKQEPMFPTGSDFPNFTSGLNRSPESNFHGADMKPPDATASHVPEQRDTDPSHAAMSYFNFQPENKATNDTNELAKALAETVNLNRLPVAEPSVFTGDPLRYVEWKTSFEILIERRGIPSTEKIFYLKKYLGGAARKAVEGFFYNNSESTYISAKKVLDERYGHPFIMQKAFRDKLDKWPKIREKDPIALRDFTDFLQGCLDALPHVPSLSILNDCTENQKLIGKIPEWAANRWNRQVSQTLENTSAYPNFKEFVEFMVKEARIACNPISSPFALYDDRKVQVRENRNIRPNVKSLSTNVQQTPNKQPQRPTSENRILICLYCDMKGHLTANCRKFDSLSIDKKRQFIKDKRLCFGCLKTNHSNRECRGKLICTVCKGRHPTCMHEDRHVVDTKPNANVIENNVTSNKDENSQTVQTVSSFKINRNTSNDFSSTSMIVPVWVSSENDPSSEILIYALLDTQSDTTFIHEDTAAALNVKIQPVKLSLSTMTSQQTVIDSNRVTGLTVRGFSSTERLNINFAYTRGFIPVERSHIPTNETAKQWHHLQGISHEIQPLQSCDVGLLLGYNCPAALAPRKFITGNGNEPYAVQTLLGWSVVGYSNDDYDESRVEGIVHRIAVREIPTFSPKDLINVLERDFAEDNGKCKKVSQDDLAFLNVMEKNITQRSDKHLEMPLPFKERPTLVNNKSLATIRLDHLKRKFRNDNKYHEQYKGFMNEMIARGDAELVTTEGKDGNTWYIPHHGVFHTKKPDKLRVVFDCSARYCGQSLNEHLLNGPDLTNGLFGVLCRFRTHPIAIMCDVEKMFHQFVVSESDRDFLRFLWWEDGEITENNKPIEYRMTKHLFGAASSPGCANYGLKHLADLNNEQYPEASKFVNEDFYVDDGLTSVKTESEAIRLISDVQKICSNGGLHLHKFVSNNRNVIESVPPSERADNAQNLNLGLEQSNVERALGVHWSVLDDVFRFQTKIKDTEPTRRNILSIVASIFDPLGFLSPFTLKGKRILQEMCKNGVGWDDLLPSTLITDWKNWIDDLDNLNDVQIPRCLIPLSVGNPIYTELHHFSDASTEGYGQCTYLRIVGENHIHCSLLAAKARVTPTKVVTIPRLELTAAVISVKMSSFLKEELNLQIDREYFWTDSKVVLGYINNDARRFHVFVANRVQIIRDVTTPVQWYYVKTEDNPADHASRGLSVSGILKSNWLTGPLFLWQREIETNEVKSELQLGDPEVKCARTLKTDTVQFGTCDILERLERFSSWRLIVSIVARIHRLAKGIKGLEPLSVEERQTAERTILRLVQKEAYEDSIRILQNSTTLPQTNHLYPLDPFIHNELLRVGGRLRKSDQPFCQKHPVILPKDSFVSRLILSEVHNDIYHQGRGITLNELRSRGYWIVGGSKTVASYIRQCVICRKLRRPTEIQKMADLPEDRLESSSPFLYCGMDCFGPITIKQGRKEIKRYGLLITCMCSRAIHIEMLDDMSTDSFINSLRCFIAIRGYVRQIRSDQGSNFVGAKNEFQREINVNKLTSYLSERQCDFVMNAPSASHTGGVWERQIRTVRNILNSVLLLCPGRLDDSSLRTVLYEVMSIVNSRPLAVNEINDPNALEPLTPNHILTAKSEIPSPPPGNFVKEDLYLRKRWRRVQYLLEQFWSRWKREYISQIFLRQKWHKPVRNMCVGDIVLVKDIDLPRNSWPLGKVLEVKLDDDQLVRRVKVLLGQRDSTKPSIVERSVHKLVLLL